MFRSINCIYSSNQINGNPCTIPIHTERSAKEHKLFLYILLYASKYALKFLKRYLPRHIQ